MSEPLPLKSYLIVWRDNAQKRYPEAIAHEPTMRGAVRRGIEVERQLNWMLLSVTLQEDS